MEIEIKHDSENNKFYTIINGKEAYLRYIMINNNLMDMIKTYVPPELRGKGIAAKIVHAGLFFASENSLKVIPSCSYVESYIRSNSEFENLL